MHYIEDLNLTYPLTTSVVLLMVLITLTECANNEEMLPPLIASMPASDTSEETCKLSASARTPSKETKNDTYQNTCKRYYNVDDCNK